RVSAMDPGSRPSETSKTPCLLGDFSFASTALYSVRYGVHDSNHIIDANTAQETIWTPLTSWPAPNRSVPNPTGPNRTGPYRTGLTCLRLGDLRLGDLRLGDLSANRLHRESYYVTASPVR